MTTDKIVITVVVALFGVGIASTARADDSSEQKAKTAANSLEALELRIQAAAKKVMPSVVAVESGIKQMNRGPYKAFASGVIISADGVILSQFHVSHTANLNDPQQSHKPGKKLKVILHDGTESEAELLGADRIHDLSLVRLTKPGPYPFAPLDPQVAVSLGDAVLKLGHPNGYRVDRVPVVRFGRVLYSEKNSAISDCRVIGGDSGGPFFDLDGRLVGIIHSSANMDSLELGLVPRTRMLTAFLSNAVIADRLESMRAGKMTETELAKIDRSKPALAAAKWSQGSEARSAFRAAITPSRNSVVAIMDGRETVGLGTVVGDGLVITKASTLPVDPKCRLADGTIVNAAVLGADPGFDLALLKVKVNGLRPVEWSDQLAVPVGSLLAAPGLQEYPLAVGIVSVSRRNLNGPFPAKLNTPQKTPAELPEILGSPVRGRGYWVEHVEGRMAMAGVQPGDVILSIADTPIRDHPDLAASVRGRFAGEQVSVRATRAGKSIGLTMTLRANQLRAFGGRSDDFPTILEHDLALNDFEYGGPLVDRRGKVIGIAISTGPAGGMAIPGDCVVKLLPDLLSGKRRDVWNKLPAQAVATKQAAGAPVTMTVDELKKKLKERGEQYKSLSVDYDLVVEANVEPKLLMTWGLFTIRDYQERVFTAFAGSRRAGRVTVEGNRQHFAPEDEIAPDPLAPPEVAKLIEKRRQVVAVRKERGDSRRLLAIEVSSTNEYIFDGEKCYNRSSERGPLFSICSSESYNHNCMYLANVGLRPADPKPSRELQKSQQQVHFPENFELYEKCQIRPTEESVDGAPCIVMEAERRQNETDNRGLQIDKIWFDPNVGFAPRKWEQWKDGILTVRITNSDFEKYEAGCWLPWESAVGIATPAWSQPEFRNKIAFSYRIKVRKVRVNDVPDAVFKQ